MYIYPAIKKKKILPFATWMELEGLMLNELSQTEKEKYHLILFTCALFKKKKQKNEFRDAKKFGGFQRVNVVKMGWVKVAKRYKLPGLKLMS